MNEGIKYFNHIKRTKNYKYELKVVLYDPTLYIKVLFYKNEKLIYHHVSAELNQLIKSNNTWKKSIRLARLVKVILF
jgi:ABC-type uncharacterized transport system substrate-binding protein